MNIAFYAPMKSPESKKPSGDRTIARLLIKALRMGGSDVRLASDFRSWMHQPDNLILQRYIDTGCGIADRLIAGYTRSASAWRPDLWLTYHVYYKASDMIGPMVAQALSIPYVIIEGSFAARRQSDDWLYSLAHAASCLKQADAVISFTERDRKGLLDICAPERLYEIAPFIDMGPPPARPQPEPSLPNPQMSPEAHQGSRPLRPLSSAVIDCPTHLTSGHSTRPLGTAWDAEMPAASPARPIQLVTAAMMRDGAKLMSYRLLADALGQLVQSEPDLDWRLDIIGDGAAHPHVRGAFAAALGTEIYSRIDWHGRLDAAGIRARFEAADIFVWPGLEEAFGMVYLEAQAAGLPVVACDTAGVSAVVKHEAGGLLAASPTATDFCASLIRMIDDTPLRHALANGARRQVEQNHGLDAASRQLQKLLSRLVTGQQPLNDLC